MNRTKLTLLLSLGAALGAAPLFAHDGARASSTSLVATTAAACPTTRACAALVACDKDKQLVVRRLAPAVASTNSAGNVLICDPQAQVVQVTPACVAVAGEHKVVATKVRGTTTSVTCETAPCPPCPATPSCPPCPPCPPCAPSPRAQVAHVAPHAAPTPAPAHALTSSQSKQQRVHDMLGRLDDASERDELMRELASQETHARSSVRVDPDELDADDDVDADVDDDSDADDMEDIDNDVDEEDDGEQIEIPAMNFELPGFNIDIPAISIPAIDLGDIDVSGLQLDDETRVQYLELARKATDEALETHWQALAQLDEAHTVQLEELGDYLRDHTGANREEIEQALKQAHEALAQARQSGALGARPKALVSTGHGGYLSGLGSLYSTHGAGAAESDADQLKQDIERRVRELEQVARERARASGDDVEPSHPRSRDASLEERVAELERMLGVSRARARQGKAESEAAKVYSDAAKAHAEASKALKQKLKGTTPRTRAYYYKTPEGEGQQKMLLVPGMTAPIPLPPSAPHADQQPDKQWKMFKAPSGGQKLKLDSLKGLGYVGQDGATTWKRSNADANKQQELQELMRNLHTQVESMRKQMDELREELRQLPTNSSAR